MQQSPNQPIIRVAQLKDGRKAIIIRTSDRISFKHCRRKWGWSSHLKRNLGPKYLASPLWFGSAIHFALEDYHGYNQFGRPSRAFSAYCIATSKQFVRDLPDDAQEHYDLGVKMMDYYVDHWLRFHPITHTYWAPAVPTGDPTIDAGGAWYEGCPKEWVPQVEVNFEIPIPLDEHPVIAAYAAAHGADCVLYRGTIDRVGIDDQGFLWCTEYKTAKRPENHHYQTDPQITTYCWAMSYIYSRPISGVEYLQYVKLAPELPRILASGLISTASNLVTSATLYRTALERRYGPNEGIWPEANKKKLVEVMQAETEFRDRYVVRELIRRNRQMCEAESQKILLEIEDMINPNLPLYPNPTRQCPYFCSFLAECVTMDDGGDWEYELKQEFSERDQDADRLWRRRLPSVDALLQMMERRETPDLTGIQNQFRDMDQLKRAAIEAGESEADIPTFTM
jgi:hypothetical protein